MKSPPLQIHDDIAHQRVEAFIRGEDNETLVGNEVSRKDAKALAGVAKAKAAASAVSQGRKLEAPHRRLQAILTPHRRTAALVGYKAAAAVLAHVPPALSRAVIGTGVQASYLAVAGEAAGLERQLRARPRAAARPPARPAARAARLPRVRALHRRADAPPVAAARRAGRRPSSPTGVDEIVARWRASGRPMIVVAGHVGSNEAVGAALAERGLPGQRRSPTTPRSPSCSSCCAASARAGASRSSRGATCASSTAC